MNFSYTDQMATLMLCDLFCQFVEKWKRWKEITKTTQDEYGNLWVVKWYCHQNKHDDRKIRRFQNNKITIVYF